MSNKKVIVFIANGSEEIEFASIVDILRRGRINVTVVGVQVGEGQPAVCGMGVSILPDVHIESETFRNTLADYDAAIVPGGVGGVDILKENAHVKHIIKSFYDAQKLVAFICAAQSSGIPAHHKITSFPIFKKELSAIYNYSDNSVVVDENVITGRGPGASSEFGLALVSYLAGKEISDELKTTFLLQ
ncbi:class I glutamine amidotransferase-like protein [Spinellus fusiger]|nr:class I glutamine amidotransferase-like protein [Spinellus fusiger]